MDFERIDINQCPPGEGNKGPNHFTDTARCKTETTEVHNEYNIIVKKINFLDYSVNLWMVGGFEEEDTNVDASRSIDCQVTLDNHFWVKF